MFKKVIYFLSLIFLGCSFLIASEAPFDPQSVHMSKLGLADSSSLAHIRLQRAERILASLVPDPESYHLILSNRPCFGGEAITPFVYSDKPTMVIFQGALSPNRSDEEIAFMMAHELGHLNLHHMEKMNEKMNYLIEKSPFTTSGAVTMAIYQQKFQEREADLYGLSLYKQAGYSSTFFPHTLCLLNINPNIHFGSSNLTGKQATSLSMNDSHFSMKERFELLVAKSSVYS